MAMSNEIAQGSDETDEMYCELCKRKGRSRPAEGFCENCVKYFCSVCLEYHSDFFPNHVQKDKFSMPQDFCLKPCSAHEDELIKFYCPSCKQFFCFCCKERKHTKCSGVSHLPAFVQNLDLQDRARATCETLEKTLETITRREGKMYECIKSVEAFATTAKTAVDKQAKAVKDFVDASCMKLKQEISKLKNDDRAKLQSEKSKLDTLKTEVESLKTDINNKEKSEKRCELFMLITTAEETAISDRVSRVLPTEVPKYKFEVSTNFLDILRDQSMGCITTTLDYSTSSNMSIFDLTDQNRPAKIGELFSELFDNEWTNAFEELSDVKTDEKAVIQELLDMVVRVFNECRRLAEYGFFERIQDCIEFPGSPEKRQKSTSDKSVILPHQLMQQARRFRLARATFVLEEIEEVILQNLRLPKPKEKDHCIQNCLSRCVTLSWQSAVQDPPLSLFSVKPRDKYDTNVFKGYTKIGPYIDYVVWPAVLLYDNGPLLAKGVAQGCR